MTTITITTQSKINILDLFVHDEYDTGNLDASELADALTAHIQAALTGHMDTCTTNEWERLTNLKVQTPEEEIGLDCFTLTGLTLRCRSWEEVKKLWTNSGLPDLVAESLERLQRSKAGWKLSNRKLRRAR